MNQAGLVGRRQPLGRFAADAQDFRQRQPAFAPEPVVERFALEELHRQERDAAVLADLVDGDDVIVLDRRGRLRLAQESLPCRGAAARAGNIAFNATSRPIGGRRPEDHAHAARAEHLAHLVVVEPAQFSRMIWGG